MVYLFQVRPIEMKALRSFEEQDKLTIEQGDKITVIDGETEHYYWKGQNKRTGQVGVFPRSLVDPQRRRTGDDISQPLKHSFIHTGHLDASGKKWGDPGQIDEYDHILFYQKRFCVSQCNAFIVQDLTGGKVLLVFFKVYEICKNFFSLRVNFYLQG